MYCESIQVEQKDNDTGKMKKVYVPNRRPVTKADVLSVVYVNGGNEVVFVVGDGRKYRKSTMITKEEESKTKVGSK